MKILIPVHLLAVFSTLVFSSVIFADLSSLSSITATTTYSLAPRNLQFFGRDTQDSSNVIFAGSLSTSGYDSIFLEVYKNNILIKRKSIKLNYLLGAAAFSLSQKIHAELSEYRFKLYLKLGATSTLINTADSLVCGDAFIVSGQSNSQATDPAATYTNEYCRSFGIQTLNYNGDPYNPADTNWGISHSDGAVSDFSGPYNVGVWALRLQKLIKENYGIPTCVINGGRASSTIEMNLRNNSNQTDLTSIYGKLLYRVKKSGLSNIIKAVFWWQGESNGDLSWQNYSNNFQILYDSWKENYTGLRKIFLFQTRPCCSEQYASQLRETQRQIAKRYSDIELVATVGASYYEGCHYSYYGYYDIADMVFRPLSKVFYTTMDTVDMRPPNIRAAYYTNALKNEVAILFDNSNIAYWPADTLGQSMKNYIFLDDVAGNISGGIISTDTVKLELISPSTATKLTYLPTVWEQVDSAVYEGPFLRNSRKIGALSFYDFPISNTPPTTLNLTVAVEGFYNVSLNKLNIKDTLKVILRNNYYPYSIRDSLKAIIDSLSFTGAFRFANIPSGTYYIVVKGRNCIETWSKSGGVNIVAGSTASYNFTTSSSRRMEII